MRLGVAIPASSPLEGLTELAVTAEQLGYDWLWINDDRLQRDPFTALAAAAMSTNSIRLGPGVTNPFSRHPALIATAIATLDELSGSRALLGLGAGGTNHRMLGITRAAPATALREAVTLIRGLLGGETVTTGGATVRALEAELDFSPVRARIPIYIGGRGPKILELAGEVADGVIVGNIATVKGWRWALDRIQAGVRRSNRETDLGDVVAWLYSSIDEDAGAARDAVRPMVATTLVTSRPVLDQLGFAMPAPFAEVMGRAEWQLSRSVIEPASALLSDSLVARLALAGTVEDCRRALSDLLMNVPEITGVVIVPFATATTPLRRMVRQFITDVAAEVIPRTAASLPPVPGAAS